MKIRQNSKMQKTPRRINKMKDKLGQLDCNSQSNKSRESRPDSPLKKSHLYRTSLVLSNNLKKNRLAPPAGDNNLASRASVHDHLINNSNEQMIEQNEWYELKPDGDKFSERAHHISFVWDNQ